MKPYYFTPRERKGYFLLFTLFLLGHSMYFIHDHFYGIHPSEETLIIEGIINKNKESKPTSENKTEPNNQPNKDLIPFDPNIILKDSLSNYGFSAYAINNLEKYRKAGGTFKNKNDLLKIYGIDSSSVHQISHLLTFPKVKSSTKKGQSSAKAKIPEKINPSSPASLEVKDSLSTALQPFDPNEADFKTLRSLGFSNYAANNLIKYRSKGGQIKKSSDLTKIYGVDDKLMEAIEPFVTIYMKNEREENSWMDNNQNSIEQDSFQSRQISENSNLKYDINIASQEELMSLRGIGPIISKNITEYRSKLGGYNNIEQLYEVYGITPELMQAISSRLVVKKDFTKFYVPSLSFKEVLRHPYADYETTKLLKNISILDYEKEILVLIENNSLDERLIPYLLLKDPLSHYEN